ncbi:MAG TPA: hypothetical protein VGQ02_00910 [Candidatus Limnocylindrales bacterium]|nr:hypothetical protein [Candidatus Limnocylindrales bacterium]
MRQFWMVVLLIGLLAGTLAGCGRGQSPIPAGAQVVHIAVIESELRLDRAIVHAGDVYVVLDTPRSSVGFASRMRGDLETGPLSDDDIARLAHGDTEGLAIGGFDLSGCSNEQRAEDLGLMGPCGNVFKTVLVEGKYAFLGPGWSEQQTEPLVPPTPGPPGSLPRSIAILQVLP